MDLLLEIGTEEMPSQAVYSGIEQLKTNAVVFFEDNRLSVGEIETFGTCRRLVLTVKNLAEKQEEAVKEIKGPAKKIAFDEAGRPQAAALGFARSQQVKVEELIIKDGGGEYLFAVKKMAGIETVEILPKLLPELILSIQFPKTMRWGTGDIKFIRPIRWLTAFFGSRAIDFTLDGLESGNFTFGNRYLPQTKLVINNIEAYFKQMEAAKVIVDQGRRRALVVAEVKRAAERRGGEADIEPKVLSEVVNLVESPQALTGTFAEEFLTIPEPVIKTAMESHQRYFPIEKGAGLMPAFIVVQNGDPDFAEHIVKGHERVLRARLADAAFFFKEDTRRPLAEKTELLKAVVYQKKLGSIFDKIKRLDRLCIWAGKQLKISSQESEYLRRAAYLCKSDLVTGMVGEFPELQGIIGKEYALVDGEPMQVAAAIAEHYLPRYSGDVLPQTLVGSLLALADKIDSVVGYFCIGLVPSGSRDPYALRRQAQGAIEIIAQTAADIDIFEFIGESKRIYQLSGLPCADNNMAELEKFWRTRLTKYLVSQGFLPEVVDAVMGAGFTGYSSIIARLRVLTQHRQEQGLTDAVLAFTRCINLADEGLGIEVDTVLFTTDAERSLWERIVKADELSLKAVQAGDFDELLEILAASKAEIDNFFETVMVMADDVKLKENRLRLLNICVRLAFRLADLSKLS